MKKLLFGLVATVFFGLGANAQDVEKIVNDTDWKTLIQNNVKILDLIVKSDIDVSNKELMMSDEFYVKIGLDKKVANEMIKNSKLAAEKLRDKYFTNDLICETCNSIDDKNWAVFVTKINTFRKDKIQYQNFLSTIGYNPTSRVNCNNWRFYVCGTGCAISIEVPPAFAGCLLICAANFC